MAWIDYGFANAPDGYDQDGPPPDGWTDPILSAATLEAFGQYIYDKAIADAPGGTVADGSITAAKISATLKPSGSAAAGTEALRAIGTTASTAAAGNDSRLSDTRTPTDNTVSTAKLVDGAVTAAKVAGDVATQAELDAHVNDTTAAHTASAISFSPSGSIAATDVQAAIQEVRDEAGGATPDADATTKGLVQLAGDLTGTAASPQIAAGAVGTAELGANVVTAAKVAADVATQAELDAVAAAAQPLDSDLTAIAALSTTSYGRAFLALADAAAGRTALGLGTAATQTTGAFDAAGAAAAAQAASQPLDSDLTAIAALTTTSYGRALLALADAAAGRTAFGLGTAAVTALDTDGTLAANSDVKVASQKAVKTYVDAHASTSSAATSFLSSNLGVATDLAGNPQGSTTDGSTVLQSQSRTLWTLRRAGGKVSLVFLNTTPYLDAASVDDITIRASVEGPGTVVQPVYFNGVRDKTMAPDSIVISDPVSFPHAKDDVMAVRVKVTVASTDKFTYNWITASGEAREESATTVTDKIDSGTIGAATGVYAFTAYTVLTDFQTTDKPVVVGQGDSIMFGYADSPFASGAGPVYQAINHGQAFLNLALIGEQADQYRTGIAHQVAARRLMTTAGKHVVGNHGTNDLVASRTLSQLQADVLAIATWNYNAGQRTYQCTLLPRTTSSDSFATTTNQTPFGMVGSPAATETIRVNYNTWLRDGAPIDATTKAAVAVGTSSNVLRAAVYDAAGALVTAAAGTGHPMTAVFEWADPVESARNSGKWKVTSTYTGDGTHPNAAANLLIAASVPTSLFAT